MTQVAVLAGGRATRMRPRTDSVPKYLLDVAGRPFADHQLAWLAEAGADDVLLCVGYLGELIREHVGNGSVFGLRVSYVDEGDELRGTAGALRLALDQDALAPEFAVVYGDSYLDLNLRPIWAAFRERQPPALMCTLRNEGRWDASNAQVSGGWVRRYDKGLPDPAAEGLDQIDFGLTIMRSSVIAELVPAGEVVDLATVYARLAAEHRLAAHEVHERFYEIGSAAGLAELDERLRGGGAVAGRPA